MELTPGPHDAPACHRNNVMGRIAAKLFIVMAAGITAIFVVEAATWVLIERPELFEQEYRADERAVQRARNALSRQIADLERAVGEYGTWDATYEFMQRNRQSPESVHYVEHETGFSTHANNGIDGILLLKPDGGVFHATYLDPATRTLHRELLPEQGVFPAARAMRQIAAAGAGAVGSGVLGSGTDLLLFAAGPITDSGSMHPPRGSILLWKRLDESVRAELREIAGVPVDFIPAEIAARDAVLQPILARLESSGAEAFEPRGKSASLYWLQRDANGVPAALARLPAEPRLFHAGSLSPSAVVKLVSAALVLLLITLYFHRTFVSRLRTAVEIVRRIRQSGSYHHRIPAEGDDEIDEMFQHFNSLLMRVEHQDRDLQTRNKQLADLSQIDSLTGIANRRFFNEMLDRSWRQAARMQRALAILLIDVDHFKQFNDHYGHQQGDRVLKQVALALQDNLHRATDFVARYGGEEFCVILTDTDGRSAVRVAETLRKAVRTLGIRHDYSDCADVVTVSIGVATATVSARVVHLDLIQQADRALYEAKAGGRDRVYLAETLLEQAGAE
jgi:diguanylate cyclase (GGDEF)-like protein